MASIRSKSNRRFSKKQMQPIKGSRQLEEQKDQRVPSPRAFAARKLEKSASGNSLDTWQTKAAKHPVLTAAAIAGLGSFLWKNITKLKP